MTKQTTWIIEFQEDPETGDAILEFPPDLLEMQGWKEGTVIKWNISESGEVFLTQVRDE